MSSWYRRIRRQSVLPPCDRLVFGDFEPLESRRLLAAHIVGNPTVFATIQAAVDAAAAGATITVDPGNVVEQVVIGKSVTVKGAQAGVDARSNARVGAAETVCTGVTTGDPAVVTYAFKIAANDVTLDGFTVQGETDPNQSVGGGVVIAPNIAGTRILNNLIQNNVVGLYLSNNSATKPVLVQHNVFRGNNQGSGGNSGHAIHSDGGISGGNLTNVTIDGNNFFDNFGGPLTTTVEPAIAFQALSLGIQSNIRVTNNYFFGNGKALLMINADGVTVSGNVVSECEDTTSAGLRFEGGVSNVTIQNNNLYSSGARAIRIDQKGSSNDNFNFTLSNNNIYQNGLDDGGQNTGLMTNMLQYLGTLTATNNWWGSSTGPSGDGTGTGDAVIAEGNNVVYSPWATDYTVNPQAPYYILPMNVDSTVQAEDYDHGTEGISYHDTSSTNSSGSYRHYQGVDVQSTTDIGGGYNVIGKATEWIEYTLNVPAAGTYTGNFRVANSAAGGAFHVEVDGVDITGALAVPNTGGLQTWQTLSKTGISLGSGQHLIRVAFDTNASNGQAANINWFNFAATSLSNPPAAPTGLAASAASTSQINLTWTDNANNESGFVIERKTGSGGTYAAITTTAANAVAFSDNTVVASTQYFYRVRATSSLNGDSANSNEASATTPGANPVYLSDLTWASMTNGWGPVEKDMSVGSSGTGDGHTITLNGVTYAKGLGAHAISDVTYNLGGGYSAFTSDVGVDDETGAGSSVIFQVFTDGVKVYDSGVMGQTTATKTISLSMAGVQQLRLHVDDAADGIDFDHADWAGARVTPLGVSAPSAPTGLSASAGSSTQINLTWSDVATETGYKIERSANGTTGWTQIGTTNANVTTFSDTTATAGTQFFYRVKASNAGGDSTPSTVANATTPPAAPTGLAASAASPSQINLTWNDVTGESGFKIERSPNGTTGWTQIGTTGLSITAYNDTTALASTQYFYRVRGTNAGGDGAYSATANATTPAAATAPAAPTGLAASAASSSQINLTWTDNSNNETGFIIERSPNGTDTWAQVGTPAANATSFSDTTGLSAGTQYFYRVRATNGVGPSGNSNVANATTFASSSPTYIATGATWKYLDNGTNQGTAWQAVAFDDSTWKSGAAELGYGDGDEATVVSFGPNSSAKYTTTYFRKTFNADDPSLVSALNMRVLRDDGAVVYLNGTEVYRTNMPTGTIAYNTLASEAIEDPANTYYAATISPALLVAGTNVISVEVHQSDLSSSDVSFNFELKATVSGPSLPPAAPANLVATAAGTSQVNLTWSDVASETGYKIERSLDGSTGWAQVGTTGANVTFYSDTTNVNPNTQYFYRVRAANSGGDSAYSNTSSTTTAPIVAPAAPSGLSASAGSSTQINLTWTDNSNNETGFIVERSPNGADTWTQVGTPGVNATGFNDTGLTASTQYFYRVRATNTAGPSANSNVANATTSAVPTAPAAPSNLVANAISASRIDLTWSDNSGSETGFIVERSPNGTDTWTQVGTPAANSTSFSNTTGLSPGTQYFYRVRATNGVGPSGNSNVADATTPDGPVPVPAPWTERDIGTTGAAGSSTYQNGLFTVKGAGSDIANKSDSFHYVYQSWTGNGQIITRVASITNTNANAKAGIMFRDTLNANSKMAALVITPTSGVVFLRRTATNGNNANAASTTVAGPVAPYWLKLIRNGSTLSAYRSTDGVNWTSIGSATVSLSTTLFVGLAVTSKVAGTLNTSTFDGVTLSTSTSATLPASAPASLAASAPATTTTTLFSSAQKEDPLAALLA